MESSHSYDVFLSHNSHDKPAVEAIARGLEDDEKLRPWLDKWNLIPGEPWQEAIEQALDASRTCAVFLGPRAIGPWENEEMRAALSKRVGRNGFRVIPVLLPGTSLPEQGKLPLFLSRLTWVDFRSGLDDQSAFRRLVAGIRGHAPGRDNEAPLDPLAIECPYRGLEVFEEEHKKFFFGRESITQHIIEALRHKRFISVIGSSGSGKSSLVRAGVIAQLKDGGLPQSENWKYVTLTPGAHPLNKLALSLVEVDPSCESLANVATLLRYLESDERALYLHVHHAHHSLFEKSKNIFFLLFIDQFEELLTLCTDEQEREKFLLNLRYASTISDGRIITLITMRADFMGRAAGLSNLAEMLSGNQFLVSPMDDLNLRRTIEEPASRANLIFENGLVERILEDVGHEPGALPLLEDALTQLYEHRSDKNVTSLRTYQELGGVHGALAKRADEVFEGFSLEEQKIARRVLLTLVKPGVGVEDTRRRAELDELWSASDDRSKVVTIVEKLIDARLLTTSGDPGEERAVDVAHEALIRGWPRLRRWIDEERVALIIRLRIAERAHEWRTQNRDDGYLYRGVELAEALKWKSENDSSLNQLEREFIEASYTVYKRETHAARMRRWAAVTALSITLGLIVFTIKSYQEQKSAKLHELASRAIQVKQDDPELSLRLALEAVRLEPTADAESALRQSLSWLQESVVLRGHSNRLSSVDYSADGTKVVTASWDHTARIWDVQSSKTLELRGHRGQVWSAFFSRDGTKVVTASEDGTACIWDANTGALLRTLIGHGKSVNHAVFSPDGTRVVTASDDWTARIWDTKTGTPLGEPLNHKEKVFRAIFSRDGTKVVTASADHTACIWDGYSGKVIKPLIGHEKDVIRVDYSPNGDLIVTGSKDKTARIWDANKGSELFNPLLHGDIVNNVAFNTDGTRVVTVSGDNTARIWDAKTGKQLVVLSGHNNSVHSAAFSRDGTKVVTASEDKTVRIWDTKEGWLLAELRGHSDEVWSAIFSPDGTKVATASWDNTARIWDAHLGQPLRALVYKDKEEVKSAIFNQQGDQVVTANIDKTACIWDAHTGELLRLFSGHGDKVNSAVLSPDGKLVVTASDDKTARIWDAKTREQLFTPFSHGDKVKSAAFSLDGQQIVTASDDKTARIWDAKTGTLLRTFSGHGDKLNNAAFSPDGKQVVTASDDNTAIIWDADTGRPLRTLSGHKLEVFSAFYSPDGERIVTASRDKTARIWDARTGQPLFELGGHKDRVLSATFSPDGNLVVTASWDKTVRIWDAGTGQMLFVLYGHTNQINSATFGPDGKQVVTAGKDGMVRIYACAECGSIEDLLKLADARNPRQLTLGERKIYLHER